MSFRSYDIHQESRSIHGMAVQCEGTVIGKGRDQLELVTRDTQKVEPTLKPVKPIRRGSV